MVALLVLVAGAVLLLPGELGLINEGSSGYLIVGAGGLLGLGVALVRWHQRERDRP